MIYGCAGPRLSPDEARFFRDADPYGFILFQRNCQTPDQVRALVHALRASVGRASAPVDHNRPLDGVGAAHLEVV